MLLPGSGRKILERVPGLGKEPLYHRARVWLIGIPSFRSFTTPTLPAQWRYITNTPHPYLDRMSVLICWVDLTAIGSWKCQEIISFLCWLGMWRFIRRVCVKLDSTSSHQANG